MATGTGLEVFLRAMSRWCCHSIGNAEVLSLDWRELKQNGTVNRHMVPMSDILWIYPNSIEPCRDNLDWWNAIDHSISP